MTKIMLSEIPEELYRLISNYKEKIVHISGKAPFGYLRKIAKMPSGDYPYRLYIDLEDKKSSGEYRYSKEDLTEIILHIWE